MAGPKSRRPGKKKNVPPKEPYKPMKDFVPISDTAGKLSAAMVGDPSDENIRRAMPAVLAADNVSGEIVNHSEAFPSKESIEARYQQQLQAFANTTTPYVLGRFRNNLAKLQKTGFVMDSTICENYYKSLLGSEESAGREFIPPKMNPTARQQIEALQKRFEKGTLTSKEQKLKALSQILAARDVLEVRPGVKGGDTRLDYRLTPEVYRTAIEKYETPLRRLSGQQIDALSQQARLGHGGALAEAYGKLAQREARQEKAPAQAGENWPTAKAYIESMQEQLRTAEDGPERLRCVTGIIAARQLVDAKRGSIFGGDKALEQRLDPKKLSAREADVAEYVNLMANESKIKLITQAKDGHGGAMLETYRKENTYTKQCANLRLHCKYGETSIDMAKAMAISKLNTMQPHNTMDEALVHKLAAQIRKEPGFKAFSETPKMQEHFHEGSFEQINYNFTRQVVEKNQAAEQAKQPRPPENQPVQQASQKGGEERKGPENAPALSLGNV